MDKNNRKNKMRKALLIVGIVTAVLLALTVLAFWMAAGRQTAVNKG